MLLTIAFIAFIAMLVSWLVAPTSTPIAVALAKSDLVEGPTPALQS